MGRDCKIGYQIWKRIIYVHEFRAITVGSKRSEFAKNTTLNLFMKKKATKEKKSYLFTAKRGADKFCEL